MTKFALYCNKPVLNEAKAVSFNIVKTHRSRSISVDQMWVLDAFFTALEIFQGLCPICIGELSSGASVIDITRQSDDCSHLVASPSV